MQIFNFSDGKFYLGHGDWPGQSVLPADAIILQRTPFTNDIPWELFWSACCQLQKEITAPEWIFIDACWDPFRLSTNAITQARQHLNEIFPRSKICVLSAKAQHYYDNIPGCVYFPMFLMMPYPDLNFRPRSGRIGCLNRRNAAHRVWLMHHLLEQKLIDPDRDVYSVSFTNIFTNNYHDIGIDWFKDAQRRWPARIATHPDNFPNDYSIDHPAWHTGIAIITETEPGVDTIVCEKTAKGILSKSCFSIYMSEAGYKVLEDLGFQPRFFPDHADEFSSGPNGFNINIEPILNICRTITTESQAMEYRQQHMDKIEHNFKWFGFRQGAFQTRPWWQNYEPKLRQALDSL
jgi:hypothetical protein